MTSSRRMRWVAIACTAMISLSAAAQEGQPPETPPEEPKPAPAAEEPPPPPKPKSPLGDPPLHRWGGLTLSGEVWGPELSNQDLDGTIINEGVDTRVLEMPTDASTRFHWRVWYHLPKDKGSIRFEYDSMRHEGDIEILDPGNFVYGELLAFPLFAGLGDDGLADGLQAISETKTREFRLEYENVAFETPRATGTFHVGYRTIDHSRSLEATYFALLPEFPPLVPPNFPPDFNPIFLFPIPDTGRSTSDFSGSGLGAGLDVEFKLHPRFSLWGSLSIGAFRGKIDTRYASSTSAYFCAPGTPTHPLCSSSEVVLLTFEDVQTIIASEVPGTGDGNPTSKIFQDVTSVNVGFRNRSRAAWELDLSIGAEFKIWRSLSLTAGMRELFYADVAADLRRANPVVQPNGEVNFEQVSEQNRSVGYEGFTLGLAYRF